MTAVINPKKDQIPKEITKFKFKEPKLRETTLDKQVRCMTLNLKKQNLTKEFLIDEIQSIDICVDRIYEIKRQLKIERQEFFRRPLTQARIKEKRKNDEHYDDFIKEYEEQESKLRDYELVYYNINHSNNKSTTYSTINASTDPQGNANQNQTASSSKIPNLDKDKSNIEKKKEKKNMQMYGKFIQKDPVFRLYKTKIADDGMFVDDEIETPSFKYKYLTKDQLLQQKLDNLPKKHNIPEKYCICCNQLVRRHYCPHDFCEKPCIRQEKEKRLRQQYLDKNGGVRKQKKPLYRASILANDISMAKSAMDETMTIEQQQEAERIKQLKIQALKEQELKIQQYKLQHAESLLPKKKGRKPKAKPEGGETSKNNGESTANPNNYSSNNKEPGEGDMSLEYIDPKQFNNSMYMNNSHVGMDIEKPSNNKEIHAQLDQMLNRKGSFTYQQGMQYDNRDKADSLDYGMKSESFHDEQQLLQQLVAQDNVQNHLGSKIIYRNEDSSYESSSSGISSGSSDDDEDKIKIDDD